MTRRPAIVKVQIGRRDLGLREDDYRSILERLTGKTSSTDCTDAELGKVLDEFKAKGWTPKVVTGQKVRKPESQKSGAPAAPRSIPNHPADHPAAKKARALWLSLWNLGEVRDSSETALEAFARRQLGVDRLQWADQGQTYKLIEALKAMAERAGWSQQLDKTHDVRPIWVLKMRLLTAQRERLWQRHGAHFDDGRLCPVSEEQIDQLVNANGCRIRDIEAAG